MNIEIHQGPVAIVIVIVIICAFVVLTYWYIHKIRELHVKFGKPVPPKDISEIYKHTSKGKIEIIESDFEVIAQRNGHTHFRKVYVKPDGEWMLEIEIVNNELIAYDVTFKSKFHRLLNEGARSKFAPSYYITKNSTGP